MINDIPTYLKDGGTYFEYYYARGMDVSSAYMSASLYLPSLSIAELAEIYFMEYLHWAASLWDT